MNEIMRLPNKVFPKEAWIQTTNLCNFKCNICPYPLMNEKISKETMSKELFDRAVSQINKFKTIEWICFNMQNEPLMDKDIFEKIKHIKSKTNLRVRVTTNGYFLNKRNISKLINSGVDKIIVSLNAFWPKTYKKITGNNHFLYIKRNIITLLGLKPQRLKLMLSFAITRDNIAELSSFQKYWKSKGVPTRAFYANNRAGILDNDVLLPLKRECKVPFEEINILRNGDVVLCRQDWKNSVVFGNLNKNSLQEIWGGERFKRFRERFSMSTEEFSPCNKCNRNDLHEVRK